MKITSSKNNYAFSDNEYAYITMSADQTTDVADTNPVKFNTLVAGNVTFNPATYRVTLKKNRTYVLRAKLYVGFTDATSYASWQFYNVTTAALVGKLGVALATSYAGHLSPQTEAFYCFTPTVDTVIELRLVTPTDIDRIYGVNSVWEIQQINIVSPVIQDPSRVYAYVSPELDLTVSGQAGFTVGLAKGQFYKTNNGSWYMKGTISATQTSGTTADLTFTGVTFLSNVQAVNITVTTGDGYGYAYYSAGSKMVIRYASAYAGVYVNFDIKINGKPTGYAIPSDV